MPKIQHSRYRNMTTVTSFGPVTFNAEGVAEVPERAAELLTTIPGWVLVSEPAPIVVPPVIIEEPVVEELKIEEAPAVPGGPGYEIEVPEPVEQVNDVVEVSDSVGNIPDLTPPAAPEVTEPLSTEPVRRISRRKLSE